MEIGLLLVEGEDDVSGGEEKKDQGRAEDKVMEAKMEECCVVFRREAIQAVGGHA